MFNLNAKAANTVNITDYELVSPVLARVIIAYTGKHTPASLRAALAEKLEGAATVVEASFREVQNGVAVGFVKALREVQAISDQELTAKFRVMSSNIVMNAEDRSLWTVKQGAASKYIARKDQPELTELAASVVQRNTSVPGLRHLTMAKAGKSELVAYVTASGDMDYGFAVGTNDKQTKLVSALNGHTHVIGNDSVVGLTQIALDKETKAQVTAALSNEQKKDAVAYWTALFSYAPDYLREVVRQVEADTIA